MTNVASFNQVTSSNQRSNDLHIYLLRSLTGKHWISSSFTVSKENFGGTHSHQKLYLQVGLHLIIIQKIAIKLFIWHQGRCHDTFLVQTELFMYKLPLSHRLTKPYFLKRHIFTVVHEKLRPPLKILSTLRNPCKQHIMVLYHSPKTREVLNVLLSATGEWPLHFN